MIHIEITPTFPQVQISQAKQRLLSATRDHTSRLDTLNELTKDKQDLEGVLDGKQKNLGGEYSGQRKADLKERQRLLQVESYHYITILENILPTTTSS